MKRKNRSKSLKPWQFKSGNPGKPKGAVNKFTTLKADWLWVHEAIGGRERLKKWVEKNDRNLTLFYQMETRLFPQEVAHSSGVSLTISKEFLPGQKR